MTVVFKCYGHKSICIFFMTCVTLILTHEQYHSITEGHISSYYSNITANRSCMLCYLVLSVCGGPANTDVWSHLLQSPSNCRQGQPLPGFPDGKRWWLHLCCFFESPLFFSKWGWKTGNKREVRQLTASIISDFCLTPASSARASTHTHTPSCKQKKASQQLSARYDVHS